MILFQWDVALYIGLPGKATVSFCLTVAALVGLVGNSVSFDFNSAAQLAGKIFCFETLNAQGFRCFF